MRPLLVATSFLTRLPVGNVVCDAGDVGRSMGWFPLIGAVVGGIEIAMMRLFGAFWPPLLVAVLITAADAMITGAMHLDGLADTTDGFGGGRDRESTLRIMREPAIGSYGTCALALALGIRIAGMSTVIGSARAVPALLLAPTFGRWSAAVSASIAPYARPLEDDRGKSVGAPARFAGRAQLVLATLIAGGGALVVHSSRSGVAFGLTAVLAFLWTLLCRKRLGGVTGDTLGAGIVIVECAVLLVFAAA